MGIESFVRRKKQINALPAGDPRIKLVLDSAKNEAHAALKGAALQTLDTAWQITLNSSVRLLLPEKKKGLRRKGKIDPAGRVLKGAADSTYRTVRLIGTILSVPGKYAEYGLLKYLSK